jgi:hypothetical protein
MFVVKRSSVAFSIHENEFPVTKYKNSVWARGNWQTNMMADRKAE